MNELGLFSTAIVIGLMGSSHCLGMCGGIAGAQSFGQGAFQPQGAIATSGSIQATSRAAMIPQLLSFNFGRLLSYSLIGFLAGIIGAALALNMQLLVILRSVAGVMLILMGLYIGQWWMGLARIEKAGAHVWKVLAPVADRLRSVQGLPANFALGVLWGWLPCGLVYSALTWAMSSADPSLAALLMLGFGIGTLPSMLAAGLFAYQLRRLFSMLSVRRVFAVTLIIFGLWSLPIHWSKLVGGQQDQAHNHSHHHSQTIQADAVSENV